jgi:Holliday junction resolvase RusA-like endonuclease
VTPEADGFTFFVPHRAAPQGSKDIQRGKNGKPFMVESSKGVKPYRTALRRAALAGQALPLVQFDGPVAVSIEFEFVKPKSNTDPYPTSRLVGDIDKLTRATFDGLVEAKVITDDSLVVCLRDVTKVWGDRDGAYVTVQHVPGLFEPTGQTDDQVILDETHTMPTQSIVDFAQSIGVEVTPWQRFVIDGVVHRNPEAWDPQSGDAPPAPPGVPTCCNPVDHKSCLMMGMGADVCPCPHHCTT